MKHLETELKNLTGTGPFVNRHNVSFDFFKGGAAHVAAVFPGYTDIASVALEIAMPCSIPELIRLLSLRSSDDLQTITNSRLMEMYLEGHAEVYCCVEGVRILYLNFSKNASGLMAAEDDGIRHEVKEKLEKAEDFINYTNRYFGLG